MSGDRANRGGENNGDKKKQKPNPVPARKVSPASAASQENPIYKHLNVYPRSRRDRWMSGDRLETPPANQGGENKGVVIAHKKRKEAHPVPDPKVVPGSATMVSDPDFNPLIFSSLERFLSPTVLQKERVDKMKCMREIVSKYYANNQRIKAQRQKDYKAKILAKYEPMHTKLFALHPEDFFVPSFLQAASENTEQSYRSIMAEIIPGVFTFDIFKREFRKMLVEEVQNFDDWAFDSRFRIIRPNTMNKFGVVLDDMGLETMLNNLMERFIAPIAKVLFPEVGGSTLDSHHGFVVEYGRHWDHDLGFHVDDAEVTLNVCLGRKFKGGHLFFRGTRCEKHVNFPIHEEEVLDYVHVPGRAVLHAGRNRHGVRPVMSGHRINLLMWCRSSVHREMIKYQTDFSSWCGECRNQKKAKQQLAVGAKTSELDIARRR